MRRAAANDDRCPRCHAAFGCEIASGGCWCAEFGLGSELLAELAAGYEGCLCPACLRELAAGKTEPVP